MRKIIIVLLCLFELGLTAQSDSNKVWIVVTKDGNEYIGEILSRTDESIELKTKNLGVITIKQMDISKLTEADVSSSRNGELWLSNPLESRYFIASNSYGLRKGEAYYQNVWVLVNQYAYGVSDNFSIGLGFVPLFLFGGESSPLWLTPKFSFTVVEDKFAMGAGALVGTVIGEDDSSFGFLYGTSTFGNRNNNLTLGIGYGYAGEDFAQRPTITLSGMIRTGKRGYILSENYFFSTDNESAGIISLGGRTVWNKISLDYGGFIPVGDDVDFGIGPWLSVAIRLD